MNSAGCSLNLMISIFSPPSSSTIPALSLNDNNYESRYSSYFIENASYLKLANMEIGYTIPEHLLKAVYMKNARIYVMGQNLLTVKKSWGDNAFTGVDPETPNLSYPIPFSVTFGVNVTF